MRSTITVEVTYEDGTSSIKDVASVARSTGDVSSEEIGLTLEEGRAIIGAVEAGMISHQVHAYALACRCCPGCGGRRRFEDI